MIFSKKSRGATGRRQRKCLTNPNQNALLNISVPASRGSFPLRDIIAYDVFGRSLSFSASVAPFDAFCVSFRSNFILILFPRLLRSLLSFSQNRARRRFRAINLVRKGITTCATLCACIFKILFEFRFHTSYPASPVSLIVGRGADLE